MTKIIAAIDTSGSVSYELATKWLEVLYNKANQLMKQDDTLLVVGLDNRVNNPKTFTKNNLDTLKSYIPCGGGGTDFTEFWNLAKAFDTAFILTDGFFSDWGTPTVSNIEVFLEEGAFGARYAPFGKITYI